MVLPELSSRWELSVVDHRGHGLSSRASRYLVTDYVADGIAFLKGLGAPAVLLGHSLGGLVCLGVVAAVPELVRGVILEDPPSAGFLAQLDQTPYTTHFSQMRQLASSKLPLAEVAKEFAEMRLPDGTRQGDTRTAVQLRLVAQCLAYLDPATLTPPLENNWLDGFDILATARNVRCPALLLAGETTLGGMLPASDADDLTAALKDPLRINLNGIGHHCHSLRSEIFLQHTLCFLDAV